jgi:predicted secreted protein
MRKVKLLQQRLADGRSKKVIFLSHCILNENTRYLGGACRSGCIREIVDQCINENLGIVQMPCPEQLAWGGVTKRLLLTAYGTKGTFLYPILKLFLPLFVYYTKLIFWRLAKETAGQIKDYLNFGFSIIGIIGIDGSPSCGVSKSLDIPKSFKMAAQIDIKSLTVEEMNRIISQCLIDGRGIYIELFQKELMKYHINIPFIAHDLMDEIHGNCSSTRIPVSQ